MKKLIFISIIGCFITASLQAQKGADSLLNFLLRNKERASFYLQKNDYIQAKLNEDKLMPVAGTMNIIIAVEFAKQAAYKVFSYTKSVALNDINKYYLPNTDGDAHKKWIKYETKLGHIQEDSIKLIDVAKGMIMFGSHANAEYLMEMLGFGNLQNDLRMFGLKQHTFLYPMASSLFLYQNPNKLNEDKVLKEIQELSNDDYYKAVFAMHKELNLDTAYKEKFRPQDLTLKMQQAWSDRLPASTAKEYARVAHTINNRLILNDKTYSVLTRILETVMETTPANKLWLRQAGMIASTTASSFSRVCYAILRDGVPGGRATKIELVYFFNGLSGKENYNLQRWMNDFDIKILKDEKFRSKIVDSFAGKKR
jgi:D-alanyl-D-alanine carboxypeptidase